MPCCCCWCRLTLDKHVRILVSCKFSNECLAAVVGPDFGLCTGVHYIIVDLFSKVLQFLFSGFTLRAGWFLNILNLPNNQHFTPTLDSSTCPTLNPLLSGLTANRSPPRCQYFKPMWRSGLVGRGRVWSRLILR